MLTPTKLDKLPEPMVQLMEQLQDDIISDICRRLTKADYLTPTAEWQLYKVNQLRLSSAEINKRIAKQLKVRERTVKELYTDTVKEAIHEDAEIYRHAISEGKLSKDKGDKLSSFTRSVAFSSVLKQGLKNTNGLMRNLTNSMAGITNRQLSDAMDLAYLKCASGAFTPAQAIFEAVQKLGAQGIKTVKYDSGRTDQVDVAVRRAVLTGINKTCCDMQLGLAAEMDCELVEVSSHFGARPSHAEWQGQIYSLKKGHPKYRYFNDATGYGTGDGLGGWNCRHSFFPFFEGVSLAANETDFTAEENLQEYNESQQQRAYERSIRKSKRELTALDSSRSATKDPELKAKLDRQFERKAVTLKNREAQLSDFCKSTGRMPDGSRVRVDGFGKSVSQKAVWANKNKSSFATHGRGAKNNLPSIHEKPLVHKVGTVDFNDKNAVETLMRKFEDKFSHKNKEYSLLVDTNGDVYIAKGRKAEIDTDAAFGSKTKGSYNTHTHPPKETEFSFSKQDIYGAVNDGTVIMQASDTTYRYRIDFNGKNLTQEEVTKAFQKVEDNKWDSYDKKGYSIQDYEKNAEHSLIEDACKELGITYVREKI